MKTYEVSFRWQGKAYRECITCDNSYKARLLIEGRYDGCIITSVREVK